MNLYKSFGCLLETWVEHGYPVTAFLSGGSESQLDATSSVSMSTDSMRLTGITVRSESEDSGVELPSAACAQTSLVSTPTFEASLPLVQTTEDKAPSSSSSALSRCSSYSSCFSRVPEEHMDSSKARGGLVEQVLRRAEPAWRHARAKGSPVIPSGLDSVPRQRSHTVSSFGSCHSTSTAYREPTDQQEWQAACDIQSDLSPGLLYLEQVCQVMQQVAMLQQLNQRLQVEMETLRDRRRDSERESACLDKGEINWDDTDGPEPTDFFRGRTVSDTKAFLKHHNSTKISRSGRFVSTDVLLEEPENMQPAEETKTRKVSRSLRLKIGSLRRNEKSKPSETDSSHSEKTTSLKHLFRSRRRSSRL